MLESKYFSPAHRRSYVSSPFAGFFLLLALGALPGQAQVQQPRRRSVYSIGGSIRDDISHRALENILVTLKQLTGATVNTAFTRSNGDFQFDGLSDGDYILEIKAKDYDQVQETITLSSGSRLGLAFFSPRPKNGECSGSGLEDVDLGPPAQCPAQGS